MEGESGLIRKRHRQGKKHRHGVRLALRVGLSLVLIGVAAALSAGIVHVVERPLPPFTGMVERQPAGPPITTLDVPAAGSTHQETAPPE